MIADTAYLTVPSCRFPPPWSAEVTPNCFIVCDANGQAFTSKVVGRLLCLPLPEHGLRIPKL